MSGATRSCQPGHCSDSFKRIDPVLKPSHFAWIAFYSAHPTDADFQSGSRTQALARGERLRRPSLVPCCVAYD